MAARVHELTLHSMQQELVGKRVGVAFAEEMKKAVLDCEDRPGDSKVRKVVIEIELTPAVDERGFCEQVWTQFYVHSRVPKRKTKPINMQIRKGGMLVFSNDGDDDGDEV